MTNYANPMTELEAVNSMLIAIGQLPVNAITPQLQDQNVALDELRKVVRELCLHGFHFNTDDNYLLIPDAEGLIAVPTGAMTVDPMDKRLDFIQKKHPTNAGFYIWNRDDHTFQFIVSFKARIKWSLTFEALPEAARAYAVAAASRKFQAHVIGDPTADRFNQEAMQRAWLTLQREESGTADHNIFTANADLRARLSRRGVRR
ncbi:hypothetical protein [Brevundimonas sp.]|uniref:hypothetical protein n=1 Tax=Brevundimonas sp. TaxID=1871086 RepID=UPI002FC67D77